MRRLLAVGAIVLAASVGTAQATTIDFEDLTKDTGVAPVPGDKISGGFLFDSSGDHLHIDGGATPIWSTTNGTTFLVEDFDLSIKVSPIAGGPFTLTSMDISEAHEFARAREVLVTGIRFGGGANPTPLTLSLDAFSTNPPGPNGFQTFSSVFGSDWQNLASVTLLGRSNIQGNGNYWALDNLVVDTTAAAVPEPGTLTLLGLGSAYLVRRRRRNRQ
jgi:PEP-CTERM motif